MSTQTVVDRLLLLALLLPLLQACQLETDDQPEVKPEIIRQALVVQPIPATGGQLRTFPAIVEANDQTNLAFRVPGQLIKLSVKSGQPVKKGQLLAQLDTNDFRNALEDREARLDLASTQYQQAYTLFRKKYASKAELDQRRAGLKSAKTAVKQAKDNLRYATLRAPFDGVVSSVSVENFQFIQPQQTIVQLQRNGDVGIRFDVPESIFTQLRKVENYRKLCGDVHFGSNTDSYRACYKEHNLVPDRLTRTYPVLFSLQDPGQITVLAGMSATINLDLSKVSKAVASHAVLIPVEAVFDQNDQQYVWRLKDDMTLHKHPVTVSGISNNMIRISQGLSPRDKIVAAGVSLLTEGQKIRIYQKERGL
ncbi:MAG: efflux transporter periplasmic adaptor subunit [Proteobacteria bacterium]|nr:MAG: efflux transporter periplasmic adaptor subunit [Pseudomonadota bacterium]